MEQLKQDAELLKKATALLNVPLQTHADLCLAVDRLWKAAQPQGEQSAAAEPAKEAPHPQQEMAATAEAPVPGKRRGRPPGTKNGVSDKAVAQA